MIKSAITNSGDQIALKLDKIVDFLQVSNQKVSHNFIKKTKKLGMGKSKRKAKHRTPLKVQIFLEGLKIFKTSPNLIDGSKNC